MRWIFHTQFFFTSLDWFPFPFFLQVLIYPCVSLPSIFCPILPLGCITLLSARRSESCNIVAQIKLNSNGNRFYLHFFKLEPYVSTDNQVVCVSARCRSYRNLKYKIGLRKRNIKCGGNLEWERGMHNTSLWWWKAIIDALFHCIVASRRVRSSLQVFVWSTVTPVQTPFFTIVRVTITIN